MPADGSDVTALIGLRIPTVLVAMAVRRTLGRKSATRTLDVHADLFEDDLDAVADAMNEAASRVLGTP